MVYETYETSAFVLSARNLNEGNRLFSLLTRDFGKVMAVAQSVRSEKSKLRYNLQSFSKTNVSLVKGREYWRVVGASEADHFFLNFKNQLEVSRLIKRVFNLLIRLLHGEAENRKLFSIIEVLVEVLKSESMSPSDMGRLELLTVARVLEALGYFDKSLKYQVIFEGEAITPEALAAVLPIEKELIAAINTAIEESHL